MRTERSVSAPARPAAAASSRFVPDALPGRAHDHDRREDATRLPMSAFRTDRQPARLVLGHSCRDLELVPAGPALEHVCHDLASLAAFARLPGGSVLLDLPHVGNGDAAFERLCHRAPPLKHRERTLGFFPLSWRNPQMIAYAYRCHPHHPLRGLHRPLRFGPQPVGVTGDSARLQRAGQGAGQSPGGGADQMVERARQLLSGSIL